MTKPDAAEQIEVARRRAEAIKLRSQGLTWQQVADELGYASRGAACTDVTRALEIEREELAITVDMHRTVQIECLDAFTRAAWKVLKADHVTVSHGKVVLHPETGKPLLDDGPKLAAIDRLLRIEERRARLLGLDVSVKQALDLSGTVQLNYQINGVSMGDLA
ncbi:hypothetical protein [Amycolatopsis sp.]|jgi:hypothetical protein|uniref:hypothetical protein n=1 Tax=Amycolatopsis sp. TaxID=37632 RepID=UPI002E077AAB|nr:hypothetical protein [Amycolatopsis sp.]